MSAWQEIGRGRAPGGGELSLHRNGDEFSIRVDGQVLMISHGHVSEVRLAEIACQSLPEEDAARVLVGGLGMGFSLRAALDVLPPGAQVIVAEIAPCVVEWNQTVLAHLAGQPLLDPRVEVRVMDVAELIRTTRVRFHAIVLDIDNGPQGLTRAGNHGLYTETGLITVRRALKPGGCLAVWSTTRNQGFERRMAHAGFMCEVHPCETGASRTAAVIYLGRIEPPGAAWSKLQTGAQRRHRRMKIR